MANDTLFNDFFKLRHSDTRQGQGYVLEPNLIPQFSRVDKMSPKRIVRALNKQKHTSIMNKIPFSVIEVLTTKNVCRRTVVR